MAATTQTAKQTKINNRKSKRDIERELRIEQKNGISIEVFYGIPLTNSVRKERIVLDNQLRYAQTDTEIKSKGLQVKKSYKKRGSDRTTKQFITACVRSAKARADKLGLAFDLKIEELTIPETCPVFGTQLQISDKITNDTPSLDRLIPELGYTNDNVEFISMKANRIKSNATLTELQILVEWMQSKNKRR